MSWVPCSCKLWRALNGWIHFCCCYFQASNCFFKWSSVGMFAFPCSFQGPLKPSRPILKISAWKLQLHGKPKIKLTFHKEFRTWPNPSHPKENQLRWFFLIPKILIFVSHHTQVLPLPFMNFCEVLFFFPFLLLDLSWAFFFTFWVHSYRSGIRCTRNTQPDSDFIMGEKGTKEVEMPPWPPCGFPDMHIWCLQSPREKLGQIQA